jgi:hypothetical protein
MKTAVLLLTLCAVLGRGADTDDKYGLRGISAVSVVIENLSPRAAKNGLTQDAIRTDVELRLRMAGMKVVPLDQPVPYIYVNVNVADYATNVRVDLNQELLLTRTASMVLGTTWSAGSVGSNPSADTIRSTIKDLVDQFLNEWLKQNPRR